MTEKNKIGIIIFVIATLFLLTLIFSTIVGFIASGESIPSDTNTIIIPIHGIITTESSTGLFDDTTTSSRDIANEIEKAGLNPNIKAIIFDINSPGGSGVAAEEIANAIQNLNKTTVSYIRDIGTSAAYWIASSTDKIYASRFSFTGSVGVISSYIEIHGLLENFNLTHRRLVAGEYKDIGSPLKEMTQAEQIIWQNKLNSMQNIFAEEVKKNRKLTDEQLKEIKTAMIYTGTEAKELNLIDDFGGRKEAIEYITKKIGKPCIPYESRKKTTILSMIMGSTTTNNAFYQIGRGIGSSLGSSIGSNQKIVGV